MNINKLKHRYKKGFYALNENNNSKHAWNKILYIGNKVYRERSEMIILNNINCEPEIFLRKVKKVLYRIPGGSPNNNENIIKTAIRETKEECNKNVKNVMSSIKYINNNDQKSYIPVDNITNRIFFDGSVNHVCVGIYDGENHEPIIIDDNDMFKHGTFYKLKDVYNNLNIYHKLAISEYFKQNNIILKI